jgi:Txe/YoeB family toxin of Txe-Axe toxin-antitoxin module
MGEAGTRNPDFSFLVFEQIGYRKAIIGSFSAHATTIGAENMEISGDYPGYWQRRIEGSSADLALFMAGSIGRQSPVGDGEQFDRAKYIGESLADSVNVHLGEVVLNDKPVLSFVSTLIELPDYHIRITPKINLSTFWSKRLMAQPENVYLQAIRIDDMVWITTPGISAVSMHFR